MGTHAEEDCVNHVPPKYRHLISNSTLYVMRFKNGLKLSKPCSKCTEFIRRNNIRKVIYSYDENCVVSTKFTNLTNY